MAYELGTLLLSLPPCALDWLAVAWACRLRRTKGLEESPLIPVSQDLAFATTGIIDDGTDHDAT
jgi:hypothetical protein